MLEKVGCWYDCHHGKHCIGVKAEGREAVFMTSDLNLSVLVAAIINKYADLMQNCDVWNEYETVDMYLLCKLTPSGDEVVTYIIDTPGRIKDGEMLNLVRVKHFEYATAVCAALRNYISTQNANSEPEVKEENTAEYWKNKYEDLVQAMQNMY